MWSQRWNAAERALAARRVQLALFAVLLVACALFRWRERLEPWNSDDMDLFRISANAASGQHWLFGTAPSGPVTHQAMRVGLLPLSLPAIAGFGPNALAFYCVPLVFALLGFGVVYLVALRSFGPVVALALALVHIVWPFELQHSSVFLSDLPCAATAVAALCSLDLAANAAGRARVGYALLAGLLAFESQLLRNNALVLMAPACLVFLASRASRVPTLWAGAVVLVGMLAFEAVQAYRGLGWGYDFTRVRAELDAYAPFLPVFPGREFLTRQFDYQLVRFGGGWLGTLAMAVLIVSLVGHALLFSFERRPLLLAIAAFGAFTWLVFSFSIYERVPEGVRAMAPSNFRYVQGFAYSSLLVWAWLCCALRQQLARRAAALAWVSAIAGPLVLLLLLGFSGAALSYLPPTYLGSTTHGLIQALERYPDDARPLLVEGTDRSLIVVKLFGSDPRRIQWRELPPGEIADDVAARRTIFVLRDQRREETMARYYPPDDRSQYKRDLKRLTAELRKNARREYNDKRYTLFAVPR